jgi:hypothetical protein
MIRSQLLHVHNGKLVHVSKQFIKNNGTNMQSSFLAKPKVK